MAKKPPALIVTGASGIVGRGFLEAAKEDFLIYAIARRSQKDSGLPEHPNIKWIQVDIANRIALHRVMYNIKLKGGADYVLHLAAYYDFDYTNHPEYQRTNVNGTRHMLEQAKFLEVKRFVFASSTAACKFPAPGETINEKSPLNAEYGYAVSKRKGEELVRQFSSRFPCSIVRFAAVFTDWCEYGALYMFLSTWLSKKWKSRILGGRGESAVAYIHSRDLNRALLTIFKKSESLPRLGTYVLSADGSTSQRELFEMATRAYYGRRKKPVFMPKLFALPGVFLLDFFGRLVGRRPFEKPWMIQYLDCKLDTDASYTREALSWSPTPRYHVLRRLLFMIEKIKHDPVQWHSKNAAAMKKVSSRPDLVIYETMVKLMDDITAGIADTVFSAQESPVFPHYRDLGRNTLEHYVRIITQLLAVSVRDNDRMLFLEYVRDIVIIRFAAGFDSQEVCRMLALIGEVVCEKLKTDPGLKRLQEEICDHIPLTIRMAVDESEDAYEHFKKNDNAAGTADLQEIEARLDRLETFYKPEQTATG